MRCTHLLSFVSVLRNETADKQAALASLDQQQACLSAVSLRNKAYGHQ